MELKPKYDRVVIRRDDKAKDTTEGGIIIPDVAKELPYEGTVIAVGQGKYEDGVFRPLLVKDGSRVLFGKYSGNEVQWGGEKLLMMREDEILAVIEE